jgi:hypothetical protein
MPPLSCPSPCDKFHRLTHIFVGDDKIVIRTGLLEGTDKWGKPAAEIYDKERPSWLPQTGDASFREGPPS